MVVARQLRRRALLVVALAYGAVLAILDAALLDEAYGSGPPYYGRTTNMDKWDSPAPLLALLNGGALLFGLAVAFVLCRGMGTPRRGLLSWTRRNGSIRDRADR